MAESDSRESDVIGRPICPGSGKKPEYPVPIRAYSANCAVCHRVYRVNRVGLIFNHKEPVQE